MSRWMINRQVGITWFVGSGVRILDHSRTNLTHGQPSGGKLGATLLPIYGSLAKAI